MVADGLPWKAQSVEDRIDKLEKAARAAKLLHDNNQEDEYAVEVGKSALAERGCARLQVKRRTKTERTKVSTFVTVWRPG